MKTKRKLEDMSFEELEVRQENEAMKIVAEMIGAFLSGGIGFWFWKTESDWGWLIIAPPIAFLFLAIVYTALKALFMGKRFTEALALSGGDRTWGQSAVIAIICVVCIAVGVLFFLMLSTINS